MELLLRKNSAGRFIRLIFETSRFDRLRSNQNLPRLLSHFKSIDEGNLTCNEKPSSTTSSVDEIEGGFSKFKNEIKPSLPKTPFKPCEFASAPPNDPDTFGTITPKNPYILSSEEGMEEDQSEEKYTSEIPNYLPQKEYANKIKKFLKQRRFADALDVLKVTMLKEHRIKPEYYIYSILIAHCGKTGYSKMAFHLYNEMKRRGLPVKASVYTSLFNSFANSPFPSDGLKRTRHLLSVMKEKNVEPNQITCHAIIKAFGRCGSVEDAFKFVDYMMAQKMPLTSHTMSFLFQACISDKQAGFRHVLLVYRKMKQYGIPFDAVHFNLLLVCTRDCQMGDLDCTIDTLRQLGVIDVDKLSEKRVHEETISAGYPWEEEEKLLATTVSGSSAAPTPSEDVQDLTQPSEIRLTSQLFPNLLSSSPSLGCVVSLSEMSTPQDRIFLLGGLRGFLNEMKETKAKPDIKTITLLLDCCPQTCVAELDLVKAAKSFDIRLDVLFYNSVIRRRALRKQYSEAKDVLSLMTAEGVQPDLMTFTNLAMACRKLTDAYELMKSMDEGGMRPGIELVTSLFGCASATYNMRYIKFVLEIIDYEEMKVNAYFLKKADLFYSSCQRIVKFRPEKFSPESLDKINIFCKEYPKWREQVQIEKEEHPWKSFQEKQPTNSETDEEFYTEHVEKYVKVPDFPRLGPTSLPKRRKAALAKLKKENPSEFEARRLKNIPVVEKLEGISDVTYQQLLRKETM